MSKIEMEDLKNSSYATRAMDLFSEGYNCSQAVFLAFEDKYGMDKRVALKLSSSFGSRKTQVVPCAFCVRGGNGDKSCASGWDEKRITKLTGGCFWYKGCFSGQMLENDPEVK